MWQVVSVIVSLKVYQKYKFGQALMYMKDMHMLYGKLNIYHDLVLDQNINDNVYSTPLYHEFWNVDHKITMLGIGLH